MRMDEGGEPQMLRIFRCAPAGMRAVEVVAAHAPNGFRFSRATLPQRTIERCGLAVVTSRPLHYRHLQILHGDLGTMLSELSIISWPLQASPTNVMSD